MKVQCDACESAVASLICFADEAALCVDCDARIHAANKLAGKHQRLLLLSSDDHSKLPRCDICQEKIALVFCLEDRAMVCRDCDIAIHAPNTLASAHQRFLATGIQFGPSFSHEKDSEKSPESHSNGNCNQSVLIQKPSMKRVIEFEGTEFKSAKTSSVSSGLMSEEVWHMVETMNVPDILTDYGLGEGDDITSKVDVSAFGDCDWMTDLNLFDESLAEVPQIQVSPPQYTLATKAGKSSKPLKTRHGFSSFLTPDDDASVPSLDDQHILSSLVKKRRIE